MRKGKWLAVLAGVVLAAASGPSQVTVIGTNTYPADVNNVQAAVLTPGLKVVLSGVFDFGETGQVVLAAPGVTLQGAASGATIKGGFYPLTTVPVPDGTAPATAKNLTIRNIRFKGWSGFAIYHAGVADEGNITRIEGNTFINTRWPDPDDGYGIQYCFGGGRAFIRKNRLVGISLFAISTHDLLLHDDDCLVVENNVIEDAHSDPLVVEVHRGEEGDINNGPVAIRNNRVQISDAGETYVWPICLGGWFGGSTSNAVVEGNILSGLATDGIVVPMYGHNRRIVNNDLTDLTAMEGQIVLMGRKDTASGNKLGPVDTSGILGNPLSAGIMLLAVDWSGALYPAEAAPDPEPVTRDVLFANDYRRTGLKGWAFDEAGSVTSMGCVLLISGADLGQDWWPGCEVTGNLIWETGRFPRGTGGPDQQVLEYPTHAHDNWIIGRTAGVTGPLAALDSALGGAFESSVKAIRSGLARKSEVIKKAKAKIGDQMAGKR